MKKLINKILEEIEDAPYKHPFFPLGLSIVALLLSSVSLITRIMQ